MSELQYCSICLDTIIQSTSLYFCCGSAFHRECLNNHFIINGPKCVICRESYRKHKIYFAGKVVYHGDPDHIYVHCCSWPDITERVYEDRNAYITMGPIVLGDDHGCCHGPATHGCGIDCCENNEATKSDILQWCLKQIDECDVVVVTYNKETNCFGTMNEVGYAYAKKKVILIDTTKLPDNNMKRDLWFAIQMSVLSLEFMPKHDVQIAMHATLRFPYKSIDDYSADMSRFLQCYSIHHYVTPFDAT